jgi:CRP-like cAMP-binding protein
MDNDLDELRGLLNAECTYLMKDETMNEFLGLMVEMPLRRGQPLIDYNTLDDSIYVVKKGIIRTAYFDGFNEKTFAFALPGTVLISYYSLCQGIPSFSKLEACCDSVIMKVTKAKFTDLTNRSPDFARWMMYMSLTELMFHEKKREIVNGDARERFEALILNRPEIIKNVSSKIIASYIGITPIYLSKLKKDFAHQLTR